VVDRAAVGVPRPVALRSGAVSLLTVCSLLAACGGSASADHPSATTSGARTVAIDGTWLTGSGTPTPAPKLSGPTSLSTKLAAVESFFTRHGGSSWSNAPSANSIYDAVESDGGCRTFVTGPQRTSDVGMVGTSCAVSGPDAVTKQHMAALYVAMIRELAPMASWWIHSAVSAGKARSYTSSTVHVEFGVGQGSPRAWYLLVQAKGYGI
jgi:hypothetical protein